MTKTYEAPGWTGTLLYEHECNPPTVVNHKDPMWDALGMNCYQQGQCLGLIWACRCGMTFRCVDAEANFLPHVRLTWQSTPRSGTNHNVSHKPSYVDGKGGRYA